MKSLRVIGDKILIKIAEIEKEDNGPIFIPDSGNGEVIMIGEVINNGNIDPDAVPIGSRVYFNKFSGTKIKYDKNEYYVIGVKDILAIY